MTNKIQVRDMDERLARIAAESNADPPTVQRILDAAAKVDAAAKPPPAAPPAAARAVCDAMLARWKEGPIPALSTGLSQLDRVLGGGLRRRMFVAMTGAAKSGKTSLFDQVVCDSIAAAPPLSSGEPSAFGLVLSPEMNPDETIARWIARALFRLRDGGRSHALPASAWQGYARIQTGEAWNASKEARDALALAMEKLSPILSRIIVERLPPLAHVGHVQERIEAASKLFPGALPVVFLDPLQRLRAAPVPGIGEAAMERINADESERAALVAAQVYELAAPSPRAGELPDPSRGLAILATCDTTKAGAGGASSAFATRGSYVLVHTATTILGFHRTKDESASAPWPEQLRSLAERLARENGAAEDENPARLADEMARSIPASLWSAPDASTGLDAQGRADGEDRLGRRAIFLECSGNRAGKASACYFGTVPGAALFGEAAHESESIAEEYDRSSPTSGAPPRDTGKSGTFKPRGGAIK